MIETFASGATASLVAKNGTKKILHKCPKVYFWMLLFKRGPKAPRRARRAPKPSAGARRRGAELPELLVGIYYTLLESLGPGEYNNVIFKMF